MKVNIQKDIELNFLHRIKQEGDEYFIYYRCKTTGLSLKDKISVVTFRTIKKELNGKEVV